MAKSETRSNIKKSCRHKKSSSAAAEGSTNNGTIDLYKMYQQMPSEMFDANTSDKEKYQSIVAIIHELLGPDDNLMSSVSMPNIRNKSENVELINAFPNALLLEDLTIPSAMKTGKSTSDTDSNQAGRVHENLETVTSALRKQNSGNKTKVIVPSSQLQKSTYRISAEKSNGENEDNILEIIDGLEKDRVANEIMSESFSDLATESENSVENDGENKLTNKKSSQPLAANICRDCKVGKLIEDHHNASIVCSNCGMINEHLLDHGPEWRQYNNDENPNEGGVNRCGCPNNFFFPKSSQGTIMVGASNIRMKRKQKWNTMVYKERSLNKVFEDITTICVKNNIPRNIIDSAKILYKRISDCKHQTGPNIGKSIIIRGDNRHSIIAACIFKACEINKSPRSVKEIGRFCQLNEKKVTKGNNQLYKILRNDDGSEYMVNYHNFDATEDYIRYHCPKLKISKTYANIAVKIAKNCCRMKLASDHNAQSVAAGALLLMIEYCGLTRIRKRDISARLQTSDATIGKIYNKIVPFADALVDDAATDHLIKTFKING